MNVTDLGYLPHSVVHLSDEAVLSLFLPSLDVSLVKLLLDLAYKYNNEEPAKLYLK